MTAPKPASSETPRTDRLESGIETRRAGRGFYMPEDVFDLLALARQLERELAERDEECLMLSNQVKSLDAKCAEF